MQVIRGLIIDKERGNLLKVDRFGYSFPPPFSMGSQQTSRRKLISAEAGALIDIELVCLSSFVQDLEANLDHLHPEGSTAKCHDVSSNESLCRYVKRAMHGTHMMSWQELREAYGRDLVSLRNEARYNFLNTLFSVSEACMYMQVTTPSPPHPSCPQRTYLAQPFLLMCTDMCYRSRRSCCLLIGTQSRTAKAGICSITTDTDPPRQRGTTQESQKPRASSDISDMMCCLHVAHHIKSSPEGCAAEQMVDRMDQGAIPMGVVTNSYEALYKLISRALYRTHVEGKLKVGLQFTLKTLLSGLKCPILYPNLVFPPLSLYGEDSVSQ